MILLDPFRCSLSSYLFYVYFILIENKLFLNSNKKRKMNFAPFWKIIEIIFNIN